MERPCWSQTIIASWSGTRPAVRDRRSATLPPGGLGTEVMAEDVQDGEELFRTNQKFALAQFQEIPIVATVEGVKGPIRNGPALFGEMLQIEPQKRGAAIAGAAESGEHIGRGLGVKKGDRAAFHSRPVTNARFSTHHDRARDQVDPGKISHPAADSDQATSHRVSHFVTGITVNQDLTSGHSAVTAPVDGSQLMSNTSTDMDPPTLHLSTNPVGGVAVDDHVAAGHFGAQVHSRGPLDTDLSVAQAFGDSLDPATVTLPDKSVIVGGGSLGIEKIAEGFTYVSVKHLCGQHLVSGLFADRRKSDGVDLNRHRRIIPESETKRHGGIALGVPMRWGG